MRAGLLRTGATSSVGPRGADRSGGGPDDPPPVAGSGYLYLKAPAALTAGQTVFAYWSIVI